MTKKKKSQLSLTPRAESKGDSTGSAPASPSPGSQSPTLAGSKQSKPQGSSSEGSSSKTKQQQEPSTSALIICRNKHWRYISSFHGPWLQLPPEVLESLAYSNYASPRPQPIDPAVFFDLVKIRHLIEEATDLAVRAANGTTSSALSNSLNATNGLLSGGSSAVLGFGLGGGGGNAKLSRERRHRMREHAAQKLARAYRLDEIAASVATMQSASALEEVAKLVLHRNEDDCDAKYVHFFHEKIPSRSLAQCTSLEPLDEVIAGSPREGSIYRTRAITRIFKDDYTGAARDLTEGLEVHRLHTAQHWAGRNELELAAEARRRVPSPRDSKLNLKEADHPSSLESQLLFHRGGVYLSLACQHIVPALDALQDWQKEKPQNRDAEGGGTDTTTPSLSPAGKEVYRRWLEARKVVKSNARRALRDYTNFISHFEYTPGLPREAADEFLRKINAVSGSFNKGRGSRSHSGRLLEHAGHGHPSTGSSTASAADGSSDASADGIPSDQPVQSTEVYQLSSLFSAQPPPNLPPYPVESDALVRTRENKSGNLSTESDAEMLANHDSHEAVTYHPLLTDALHSLLLCHALVQTSKKELLRHAHMVARLARVCDGYPIFLAPRSPARADWIEVLHHTDNWIELKQSWETLCAPAPLPGHTSPEKKEMSEDEAREQRKHEAILEALADDRVQDEESFRAAVRAREKRSEQQGHQQKADHGMPGEHGSAPGPSSSPTAAPGSGSGPMPKRWAQEDGKEYPICTDRAETIGRWIRESPIATGEGKNKAKRGGKKRSPKPPSLEGSFHELSFDAGNEAVD